MIDAYGNIDYKKVKAMRYKNQFSQLPNSQGVTDAFGNLIVDNQCDFADSYLVRNLFNSTNSEDLAPIWNQQLVSHS